MAVWCSFRACIRKQSLGHDIIVEGAKPRLRDPRVCVLIQHFVAVTQVSARGVAAGGLPRSGHDSCTHCGLPVFLAERLLVGSKRALYHRTCFRCARCSAQLTLANCYETEDGGFCCEVCPDEELDKSDTSSVGTDRVDLSDSKSESAFSATVSEKPHHRTLSLSDDEKSAESQLKRSSGADEYSALFESTVENFQRKSVSQQNTDEMPLANTEDISNDLVSKPDGLSQALPHNIVNSNFPETIAAQPFSYHGEQMHQNDKLSSCQSTKEGTIPINKALTEGDIMTKSHDNENVHSLKVVSSDSNISLSDELSIVSTKPLEIKSSTKEFKSPNADDSVSSIVKMRKLMFEGESAIETSPLSKRSSQPPMKVGSKPELESKSRSGDLSTIRILHKTEATVPDTPNSFMDSDTKEEISHLEEKKPQVLEPDLLEKKTCGDEHEDLSKTAEKEEDISETGKSSDIKSSSCEIQKEAVHIHGSVSKAPTRPSVSPRKVSLVEKEVVPPPSNNPSEDYPAELNPFGEDEDQSSVETEQKKNSLPLNIRSKESSNPFGSSDEDEPVVLRQKNPPEKPPRPPLPKSILVDSSNHATYDGLQTTMAKASPVPAVRRVIAAPASLNPFWSDGEEPEEEATATPVPLPRTLRTTPEPSPRPRTTVGTRSKMLSSSGAMGSTSSLSSMASNTGTNRRSKKPAPAPPPAESSLPQRMSLPSSPNLSIRSPHKRKSRPAPLPPNSTNVVAAGDKVSSLDGRKMQKDEANRTVQAEGKEDQCQPSMSRDKSTFGQWKRKKGPAPPRPLPQRRQVRAMPMKELKQELDDIEVKQLELERQGVKLEQTIRHKFDAAPALNDSSMTPDVEDLVIQLFELVNEKNELFRKQAELMYLRRQQRLEEEHAELEYQIRCLMEQPERNKTDTVKAREEELIQRLIEVVERRNEIIECLEMDRIREAEEDQSIHSRLGLFAAKTPKELDKTPPSKIKKDKKKKKEKDSKKKKDLKIDADKDIDEVEAAAAAAVAATKEKKSKRKWF